MGSYNAKPSTSDDRDQRLQPTTSSKQTQSGHSHPFTIEDTSDTDGDEAERKRAAKHPPSPLKLPKESEAVMQDEQRQRELAQERHREEIRVPSGGAGEPAAPYGLYNPLAVSDGVHPYPPPVSASPIVAGSGMNPGSLPLLQYPGQPVPPLVAINPTSTAVFAPYPSAFTSPAAIYSGLHSSSTARPYHGIESYSAMLASMGSHAQQQLQGHLIPAPSYFPGGYIPAGYTPLSPLMAGVVPTSKGMFPEGSYLPSTVGPHVLTGILPSGSMVPSVGAHSESPGEDRGRASPDKHYSASGRYLTEAREQQILESRRLAELQQLSPSAQAQAQRSIPEARVSPFQQVSYRVAIPEAVDRPDSKGTSPGASLQKTPSYLPTSKDVLLHTSTPKQVLGGSEAGDSSSRQVQLALLPNTFYCGSVPGQAMVATTEGTIRVELPPPTIGINIGTKPQSIIPNPSSSKTIVASSNVSSSTGSIFTFPSSSLPPLTSISSSGGGGGASMHGGATPSSVPYQGSSGGAAATTRHHSPTYSATVAGLQSWHLSPTPQVRPTPSVRFQGSNLGSGMVAGTHPDGEGSIAGAADMHSHQHHADTTQTSPSTQQHHSPHHHPHSHHHGHHHHHSHPHSAHSQHPRHHHSKASPVGAASGAGAVTARPHHQPTSTLPSYFTRGSIIQLANSVLKRVEDLTTDDFVQSAGSTEGLKIDSSTVLRIDEEPHRGIALIGFLVGEHKAQVTVEAPYEHPFFVFGQGWSSVRPELSLKCYGLQCHPLAVGDVCVSLTVIDNGKQPPGTRDETSEAERQQVRAQLQGMASPEVKRRRVGEEKHPPKPSDHHPHHHHHQHPHHPHPHPQPTGAPVVQGLAPSRTSSGRSSPSPGHQQQPAGEQGSGEGGPYEVTDHSIDKNFNIVQDKPLELPHMKLMRPPKRRWSDPVKASQEGAGGPGGGGGGGAEQHSAPPPTIPETLGKVQQQQQR